MTNQAAIDLLTGAFTAGSLQHPGNEHQPPFAIPLPGFRNTGMGTDQTQDMIGAAAQLWAEALTHILETQFEIMTRAEIAQLRQDAADAPDGTRIIRAHRGTKTGPVICELVLDKTDDIALPHAILRETS